MTDSPDPDAPDRGDGGKPDLAGFLHSESPRRPSEPDPTESLRRPPPPPGDPGSEDEPAADMRNMEKSLVERIADVDDDRRRTAIQLRKALETHREEIRALRQRDHRALLVLMGIGIILLAAVLLLFSQLFQTRGNLDTRLAALESASERRADTDETATGAGIGPEQHLAQLREDAESAAGDASGAAAEVDPQGDEDVDDLANAIEAIGDRLTALEGRLTRLAGAQASLAGDPDAGAASEPPSDGAAVAAAVGAAEDRLEQKLAALASEIEVIRASRGDASTDASDAGTAAAAPTATDSADRSLTTEARTVALQLAGFPSRAAIDRFIAQHTLPDQVYLTVDPWRGQSWYGLVHSLHPDMDSAEAVRSELPSDLARLDIWLRELPPGSRLQVLDGAP